MIRRLTLAALICLPPPIAGRAQESVAERVDGKASPTELARMLMDAQDRLVVGDVAAKARVPVLAAKLAERFLSLEAEAWRETRNVQAAVAYTLSGGQPRVLRGIIQSGRVPSDSVALASGALAYAEGREDKARELLGSIDAARAPASLAGLLCLAQAALLAKSDPASAARLLDEARVFAPGALVEEAALRRSVLLAYATYDFSRFIGASSKYFRRFGKSLYADDFRKRFVESIARFGLSDEQDQKRRLSELLLEVDASYRADLYLSMSQFALYMGKLANALSAAEKALKASESGVAAARAKLYAGAAKVLSGDVENGAADLSQSAESVLSKKDRALRVFVVKLAQQIMSDPQLPDGEPKVVSADNSAGALIDKTEFALSQVDELLRRSIR